MKHSIQVLGVPMRAILSIFLLAVGGYNIYSWLKSSILGFEYLIGGMIVIFGGVVVLFKLEKIFGIDLDKKI